MTVGELRERLEKYDDDLEVRFASQPQWAFEYAITGAASFTECVEAKRFNEDDEYETSDGPKRHRDSVEILEDCVYLYEGTQIGYLSAAAKEGWEFAEGNY